MPEQLDSHGIPQIFSNNSAQDEISLLDLAVVLARHKKLIISLPIITALIVGVMTLFIPNTYSSTAKILPVSGTVPKETIISLLQSQPMNDAMIRRFKLMDVYQVLSIGEARARFSKALKVDIDKQGLIDINVEDSNPKRAALIANAHVDELKDLISRYGLTEFSRRRVLLERLLAESRQAAQESEKELAQIRQQSGDLIADSKFNSFVKSISAIKAKIAMKEMEMYAMGYDLSKNPNYILNLQEYSTLWSDMANLENKTEFKNKFSATELDYLKKFSEYEYNQTRYDQLLKQVEKAKFDEMRETPSIQVLDRAEVPDLKSRPRRALIIALSFFTSGLVAMLWVMFSEVIQRIRDRDKDRFRELIDILHWKWRSS